MRETLDRVTVSFSGSARLAFRNINCNADRPFQDFGGHPDSCPNISRWFGEKLDICSD